MDQPVVPFDLHRMFLGDAPPLFLLEIVARTLIVYAYTLLLLRWIGGRSVTQLSLVEFLLVIALGSAVGDSLFYPDVPLIHALLVITLVVVVDKVIDAAIVHSKVAERVVDGAPTELLRDGHLVVTAVGRRTMGRSELNAALRNAGIRNLGELAHVFMELSGKLSIFRAAVPVPGLPIMPPHDLAAPPEAGGEPGPCCCTVCGLVSADPVTVAGSCPACGNAHWTRAQRVENGADDG